MSALNRKYRDKHGTNLLLTKHFQIGVDGYKHKHNTNVLVIGGSGAGKTRTYAVPNVLQAGCSMVITDPKAEILRKTGAFLLAQGYEVRVFDLIDPSASFCYNPFCYVQSDKDVLQLIADLIQNTTPPNAHENDPFWSKAETALLQALMLYLIHEAPADEQNFAMVMEMIAAAEVREDDADYQSPLDILFERLEMREPDSIACKQYRIFKQAAGKTARSILVSVGVRLAAFNLPQIARLTMADELHLEELGERKIALFCCIPDSDKSLNYLVGMIYSQLIQTLYRQADRVHRGRLPVPVHLLIDEFPNISLPKDSFFVCAGDHAFARYFLLDHRAEHGAAQGHVQKRLGVAGRSVRRIFVLGRQRAGHAQVCFGADRQGNDLDRVLQPKPRPQRQLQREPADKRTRTAQAG